MAMVNKYHKWKAPIADNRFLLGGVILLGTVLRLAHLAFIRINLPFGGGGLFMEFAQQIVIHHYLLPSHIPFYTDGGIPYAYPPLPFYVEAVLLDVFSLPKFPVATLLPPAIAVLTLPSFYLLTRQLGLSIRTRLAALVAYGTMPVAFLQPIEGAGLAEAFGSLALIWLAISLVQAHKRDTIGSYGLVGLLWAVCVLVSPGTAYASLPTVLIFVVLRFARANWRPNVRTIGFLVLAGAVAVLASGPYWLTVTANHGIEIFTDSFVFQHQHGDLPATLRDTVERFMDFDVSQAPYPLIWDSLIVTGLLYMLLGRQWALPAWFVALFCIPREGPWMAAIPAAVLAAIGGVEVFGRLVARLWRTGGRKPGQFVIFGGLALLLGMYVVSNPVSAIRGMLADYDGRAVSDAIAAMEWAEQNTPFESKFIVLLPDRKLTEWSPQIARRTVLNVPQGSEWEPEERSGIQELERLLKKCGEFSCVQVSVAKQMGYDEVYLLVDRDRLSKLQSASSGENGASPVFELIWRNREVAIGHLSAYGGVR